MALALSASSYRTLQTLGIVLDAGVRWDVSPPPSSVGLSSFLTVGSPGDKCGKSHGPFAEASLPCSWQIAVECRIRLSVQLSFRFVGESLALFLPPADTFIRHELGFENQFLNFLLLIRILFLTKRDGVFKMYTDQP